MTAIAERTPSAEVRGAGAPRPIAPGYSLVETSAPPADAASVLTRGAGHQTPEFLEALESVIAGWGVREPRKAMSFFTSHVHTDGGDDGHWEMTLALVGRHLSSETDAARFLATMRASMSALTAAYDEYVDGLAVFAPAAADRAPRAGVRS